jgi:hypothetical protein
MKCLTLYRLDQFDGGERHKPTNYYFEDKDIGGAVAGPHDVLTPMTIIICEAADEIDEAHEMDKARSAIAKLTQAERLVLGLRASEKDALADIFSARQADAQ